MFQASRYISSEYASGSTQSLAGLQTEVLKALGTRTIVQLRQIQLTLDKIGTSSGPKQLELPPRLRFAVQNALTGETTPSAQ